VTPDGRISGRTWSGAPLAGRRVVVLGAAGEVGEGVVRRLRAFGAHVIAVSRAADRLARLERAAMLETGGHGPGTLATQVGDVGREDGAMRLRETMAARHGPLDAVIASLGGWRQGPAVTDTPWDAWREALDQSLTAHVLAVRALLPVLADRAGASYTLINGGAALHPVPGAGAMCVSAAGQLMLAHVLAAEHRGRAVRVNTLVLSTPVRTRSRPVGREEWISADDAGTHAAYLASDAAAAVRGATVVLDHPNATRDLPPPFGSSGGAEARPGGTS
jgi:NAD(P)-dependent dehydrogenase (short-subunit alcohol dehydrogenase family)